MAVCSKPRSHADTACWHLGREGAFWKAVLWSWQSKRVIQHLGHLRQGSAATPKPRGTDAELLKQDDAPRLDPGSDSVQAGLEIALGAEN